MFMCDDEGPQARLEDAADVLAIDFGNAVRRSDFMAGAARPIDDSQIRAWRLLHGVKPG